MDSSASIRRFTLELLLIVIGVLLALWVDQWRDDRASQARFDRATASIVDEIETNRAAVQSSLDYHKAKMGLLWSYAHPDSAGRSPQNRSFDRGYTAPAPVIAAAWQNAQAVGIVDGLDWDTALRIAELYAQQERYVDQSRLVGELIYGSLLEDGPGAILRQPTHLATILSTFWYREQQMLEAYDEALETLAPGEK